MEKDFKSVTPSRLKQLKDKYKFDNTSEYNIINDIVFVKVNLKVYVGINIISGDGLAQMSLNDPKWGWCAVQWAETAAFGRAIAKTGLVDVDEIATGEELSEIGKQKDYGKKKAVEEVLQPVEKPVEKGFPPLPASIKEVEKEKPETVVPDEPLEDLEELSLDILRDRCDEIVNYKMYPGKNTKKKLINILTAAHNGELEEYLKNYTIEWAKKCKDDGYAWNKDINDELIEKYGLKEMMEEPFGTTQKPVQTNPAPSPDEVKEFMEGIPEMRDFNGALELIQKFVNHFEVDSTELSKIYDKMKEETGVGDGDINSMIRNGSLEDIEYFVEYIATRR